MTSFTADQKYVVSKPMINSIGRGNAWEIKRVGESIPIALCKKDFNEFGTLHCTSGSSDFRMSKKTLRFLHAYLAGYWAVDNIIEKEGGDTPDVSYSSYFDSDIARLYANAVSGG